MLPDNLLSVLQALQTQLMLMSLLKREAWTIIETFSLLSSQPTLYGNKQWPLLEAPKPLTLYHGCCATLSTLGWCQLGRQF